MTEIMQVPAEPGVEGKVPAETAGSAGIGPFTSMKVQVSLIPHSPTLLINEISNALIANGKEIYKFGLGQSPFPVPRPVVKALQENAHQKDYLPCVGLKPLRYQYCKFLERTIGLEFDPENVLVAPGTKELLLILQLVYPAEFLMISPSWVSYLPQAKLASQPVRMIHTDFSTAWKLSGEELDRQLGDAPDVPRILILNSPNNPTGLTYTAQELQSLARVCRKRRILVVADDIYSLVNYSGRSSSIAQYYPEGSILSDGLSKWCGAGGWRLGMWAFPSNLSWLKHGMMKVASEGYSCVSAPIQFAAIKAFEEDKEIEVYVERSRKVLHVLSRWCCRELKRANISVHESTGGFYVFLLFDKFKNNIEDAGITSDADLCSRLLKETGVAVLPGSNFGRDQSEMTARLSFVDFDGETALNNVDSVEMDSASSSGEFVVTFCPKVHKGINKLVEWITNLPKLDSQIAP